MMTICKASGNGLHRLEWRVTGDGGGHWACTLPGCEAVEPEGTGHNGGHIVLDTLIAAGFFLLFIWAMLVSVHRDREYWKGNPTVYTKEAPNAHE